MLAVHCSLLQSLTSEAKHGAAFIVKALQDTMRSSQRIALTEIVHQNCFERGLVLNMLGSEGSHSELLAEEPQAANLQLRSREQLLLQVLCGNLYSGCGRYPVVVGIIFHRLFY